MSRIVRVVDALAGQDRIILWLDCNHKLSVSRAQVEATPRLKSLIAGEYCDCHFCPPPSPKEKSARVLWRDAGEP